MEAGNLVNPTVVEIFNPLRRPRGFRQCRAPTWFFPRHHTTPYEPRTIIITRFSHNYHSRHNTYNFWKFLAEFIKIRPQCDAACSLLTQ